MINSIALFSADNLLGKAFSNVVFFSNVLSPIVADNLKAVYCTCTSGMSLPTYIYRTLIEIKSTVKQSGTLRHCLMRFNKLNFILKTESFLFVQHG
jgi:hypothetical protein